MMLFQVGVWLSNVDIESNLDTSRNTAVKAWQACKDVHCIRHSCTSMQLRPLTGFLLESPSFPCLTVLAKDIIVLANGNTVQAKNLSIHASGNYALLQICLPVPLFHCFGCVLGALAITSHGASMVFPGEGFDLSRPYKQYSRRNVQPCMEYLPCSLPSWPIQDLQATI